MLTVYSATKGSGPIADTSAAQRQAIFVVLGVGVMAVTAMIDYELLRDWARAIYGGVLVLLAAVLLVGAEVKGISRRLVPDRSRPAPAVRAGQGGTGDRAGLVHRPPAGRPPAPIGCGGAGAGSGADGPDPAPARPRDHARLRRDRHGHAAGGRDPSQTHGRACSLFGAIGVTAILSSGTLEEYQTDRLKVFVDPEGVDEQVRYNLAQAQIAISSGGMLGQGWGEGSQTQLDFVPEQQTDFIFTAVGEELGFVGAGLLLVLYGLLSMRILRAAQLARIVSGCCWPRVHSVCWPSTCSRTSG